MVDENCASADGSGIGSLSAEEEQVIAEPAEVYRRKMLVPCTACKYCMPCFEQLFAAQAVPGTGTRSIS